MDDEGSNVVMPRISTETVVQLIRSERGPGLHSQQKGCPRRPTEDLLHVVISFTSYLLRTELLKSL